MFRTDIYYTLYTQYNSKQDCYTDQGYLDKNLSIFLKGQEDAVRPMLDG